MDNFKLHAKIMTAHQVLLDEDVLALSSRNSKGNFDILPQHANFISIIDNQPIIVTKLDQSKVEFKFTQAIIHNSSGLVMVFAEPTNQ